MKTPLNTILATLAALLSTQSFVLAQGSLNPPGAPAPTMKTLDQLDANITAKGEKRTPISSLPTTITQSGSYYLTQNLTAFVALEGIFVKAHDVTIDLNGFQLDGAGVGTWGVRTWPGTKRATIRNGSLRDWTVVAVGDASSTEFTMEGLRIEATGGGIQVGDRSLVRQCNVHLISGGAAIAAGESAVIADCIVQTAAANSPGIVTGQHATIRNCVVSGFNRTTYGISMLSGSVEAVAVRRYHIGISSIINVDEALTIHRSTVRDCNTGIFFYSNGVVADCVINGGATAGSGAAIEGSDRVTVTNTIASQHTYGIKLGTSASLARCTAAANSAVGINVGDRANVSGCTAVQNASGIVAGATAVIADCLAANNTADGIRVSDGAKITGCTARQNGDTGIEVTGGAFISGNNCDGNRYGIYGNGAYSRIERNNIIYHSDTGLWLSAGGNTVFSNTFRSNGTAILAPGNDLGPTGSAATATSPFANILF